MPFASRWYFVTISAVLSITLAATVFALYWYSHKNDRLCSEDSAIPGWKFVPTLIAVLYTQLTAMIFGAVKWTEPFAKMARTNGRIPVAHYTLLEKANSTILHNDLVCTELSLKEKEIHLRPADGYESHFSQQRYSASVLLESNHGCQLNLTVNISFPMEGHTVQFSRDWISWSDIHTIIMDDSSSTDMVRVNQDCHEEEIIIMSTPCWLNERQDQGPTDTLDNMTMSGYACHADYSMATIPVRAITALNALSVEFDEELFNQMRTSVPSTVLDLHKLHEIYTDTTWGRLVPQESALDPRFKILYVWGCRGYFGNVS
jgi:hypothetical protein